MFEHIGKTNFRYYFSKVVQMLEDLQAQVLAEGEAEAATYNKFVAESSSTAPPYMNSNMKGPERHLSIEGGANSKGGWTGEWTD